MNRLTSILLTVIVLTMVLSCQREEEVIPNNIPVEYEGWELLWHDEFDGPEINPLNWVFETGDGTDYGLPAGWGNNELQLYTNSSENAQIVSDNDLSVLKITAMGNAENGYTSAKITSNGKFRARFGRVEIRAKFPSGQGLLPAIWMLGENRDQIDWPGCGEIDIVEILGHQPGSMYSTLHYTNEEHKHGEKQVAYVLDEGDFASDYHVFTLTWTPDTIRTTVDSTILEGIVIDEDMKEFLRSFYLIMNVAVGGNWPGDPNETTVLPQSMLIDYIRVYSKSDFVAPEAPELDIEEETEGQVIPPNIADYAIRENYNDLGDVSVLAYGPGQPALSGSETAVDGEHSMAFDFPGTNWGGAYLQMQQAVDMTSLSNLKFALNKPDNLINAEIKLESSLTSTNAIVFLKDYTAIEMGNGFMEYTIPLADFTTLDLSAVTIPFAMWNAMDADNKFVKATVLIDDIRFE